MPKTTITRYVHINSDDVASVGFDPESSTMDIEWLSRDEENGDHVLTMRRYQSVSSFMFARIVNSTNENITRVIAQELRGARGVVVVQP